MLESPLQTQFNIVYALTGLHNFVNQCQSIEEHLKSLGENEESVLEAGVNESDYIGRNHWSWHFLTARAIDVEVKVLSV